ncbi:MAG: DUF5681 domain-containing protein [Fimbriimonadaceae bacterium]|nr:DUF5681 domain-containing protein [Alphaproteobacteria bacterium]
MSGKVGPGNPPRRGRFKKGRSGNPKGRPRKQKEEKSESAFDIILEQTLTITRNGVPCEVTVEEALQHKTYQDAIRGSRPAMRKVMKMINKREAAIASKEQRNQKPIDLKIESGDPDNANEAMKILGVAKVDDKWADLVTNYDRLLLEPWAVQMALSRRRGGMKLSSEEIKTIERCTRDPETLKWPQVKTNE